MAFLHPINYYFIVSMFGELLLLLLQNQLLLHFAKLHTHTHSSKRAYNIRKPPPPPPTIDVCRMRKMAKLKLLEQ